MNQFVVKDENGQARFLGSEDRNNPPVNPHVGEDSKMVCPQCGEQVDYLLGSIKPGCEACYRPEEDKHDEVDEPVDESKVMV